MHSIYKIKMENIEHKKNFHDKHYKKLLIIPLAMLIFSLVYVGIFYSSHNDLFYKDISLKGGTSVTIYEKTDISKIEKDLSGNLEDINVRGVYDLTTKEQKAIIILTTTSSEDTKKILEDYLGYELDDKNSSFEFSGASLSHSFYKQLLIALLVAFIFMAIVIFIIFRNFVPSAAIVLSAFADMLMTLVVVDILGIQISSAGIVAFLMLIGYSVDTDILLTSRVLKRQEEHLNERIWDSFKTGITMTLTAIASIGVALLVVKSFSFVLAQIFTIILIGLFFDMVNTWITNVSILKWYMEKKK
jgi:preprotein translocase subunit SecF